MGPSGSGKSTLLALAAGILVPSAGSVSFGDTAISALDPESRARFRREVGLVFQTHNLFPSFTVRQNVEFPLLQAGVTYSRAERKRRVVELLDRVGLSSRINHHPDGLSGGECQRVAIAVALARHPCIILADEPTGELDSATRDEVINLLVEVHRAMPNRVTVLVTHDPAFQRVADRLFLLRDGVIRAELAGVELARSPQAGAIATAAATEKRTLVQGALQEITSKLDEVREWVDAIRDQENG